MTASISTASAIALYVRAIERPVTDIPETIFHLKPGLEQMQRAAVLSELRKRYPGTEVSPMGDEIILKRPFHVAGA
jgi:hypothetical protein